MATHNKQSVFKTPQKSSENLQNSTPPLKLNRNRYKSPLANIQNVSSSKVSSCQFTSASSMCVASHNFGTPPRAFFKIKNPFEKHLIDNLHTPICSPGMFKIRESETGSFKWDIEHVSILKPADIVPCNSQFDPSPDPVLEEKATKAIERFFAQEMIVPSPMDEVPKRNILLPMDSKDDHTTPEGTKSATRDVWTQTALTLPIDLPPELENTLQAFCTFSKQEQIGIGEADISANASLRRKLCFEEIYSDVEEEEVHMSVHNISCPVFHSPQVNPLHKGFRRNFDTPQSKNNSDNIKDGTPGTSNVLSDEELNAFSPIVKQRTSNDDNVPLKSPSMSPIQKSPKEVEAILSPQECENDHHSCNASPFSQSTPEKSSMASKSSNKSSPDTSDNSDIPIQHKRNVKNVKYFIFTDDMCNMAGDASKKITNRSKSELSITSLGRSRSAIKLDFSMDVSENSIHLSGSGDSEPDSPKEVASSNCWDLEMPQFMINMKKSEETKCIKCDVTGTVNNINCDNFVKENLCDCQSAIDDDRLKDVYEYITPPKNKAYQVSKVDERNLSMTHSSPMQMSPPTSCVPIIKNTFGSKQFELSGSHFNVNHTRSLDEYSSSIMSSTSLFKSNVLTDVDNIHASNSFKSKDSGFNDHLGLSSISSQNSTLCHSSAKNNMDSTKSFFVSSEGSSVSWKRFDSGFNEESSDFSQHASQIETSKQSMKYHPLIEYSENKENIYFGENHTVFGQNEEMSVSDIFQEEEVSFANCNYFSTPSHNRYYRNTK